jgi:hypothetical protein
MKNLKQQFSCLFILAACLLAGGAPHAAASVIVFDNGPPNHLNGNNLGLAFQAEDFRLAGSTTLAGISFWSLETSGGYRGSISWSIMSNGAGAPGAVTLASGTQSAVNRTALGSYFGLNEYRNDFSLNAPLALGAGTYWLVLHNGAPSDLDDPDQYYWESAAGNATLRGVERYVPMAGWTTTGSEHAFQVSAVPEPAHVLMLLAGLPLAAFLRRRDPRSARFA